MSALNMAESAIVAEMEKCSSLLESTSQKIILLNQVFRLAKPGETPRFRAISAVGFPRCSLMGL